MSSTLSRGLTILTLLNQRSSATVGEMEQLLSIPKATIYRILAVLTRDGFVYRHGAGNCFRLTQKVKVLSAGLMDGQHLPSLMRPFLEATTQQLRWPASFCTLSDVDLIVQDNTDYESPLAVDRFPTGHQIPLLNTASGMCILAQLGRRVRNDIFHRLLAAGIEAVPTGRDRLALERQLNLFKKQGFAICHRRRQHTEASTISVPIIISGTVTPGALTIRYARAAVKGTAAIQEFVAVLRASAAKMAAVASSAQVISGSHAFRSSDWHDGRSAKPIPQRERP